MGSMRAAVGLLVKPAKAVNRPLLRLHGVGEDEVLYGPCGVRSRPDKLLEQVARLVERDVPQVRVKVHERARRAADSCAVRIGAARRVESSLGILALAVKEGGEDGVAHAFVSLGGVKIEDGLQVFRRVSQAGVRWDELLGYLVRHVAKDAVYGDGIVSQPSISDTDDAFPFACKDQTLCGDSKERENHGAHGVAEV